MNNLEELSGEIMAEEKFDPCRSEDFDDYSYFGIYSTSVWHRDGPTAERWKNELIKANGNPEDYTVYESESYAKGKAFDVRESNKRRDSYCRNPIHSPRRVQVKRCNKYGIIKGLQYDTDRILIQNGSFKEMKIRRI